MRQREKKTMVAELKFTTKELYETDYALWVQETVKQLKDELEDSPSLSNYFYDILTECYQDARELVSDASGLPLSTFPETPIATVEQVLNEDWFP
jgi:hypothetical protein